MPEKFVLGLDFGSASVKTLVASCLNGAEIASAVAYYPRSRYSNPIANQFRRHPLDHIESTMTSAREAIAGLTDTQRQSIIGSGVDTTGSTPAPIDKNSEVLAFRPDFAENPNAMFLLWKDHTAINEAEEITTLCHSGKFTDYSRYVGGAYPLNGSGPSRPNRSMQNRSLENGL